MIRPTISGAKIPGKVAIVLLIPKSMPAYEPPISFMFAIIAFKPLRIR